MATPEVDISKHVLLDIASTTLDGIEGAEIATPEGEIVGNVTSGGFGPTLNGPCAMGYVARAHATPGTRLDLIVRGRNLPATVAPMPFVPNRYKR